MTARTCGEWSRFGRLDIVCSKSSADLLGKRAAGGFFVSGSLVSKTTRDEVTVALCRRHRSRAQPGNDFFVEDDEAARAEP